MAAGERVDSQLLPGQERILVASEVVAAVAVVAVVRVEPVRNKVVLPCHWFYLALRLRDLKPPMLSSRDPVVRVVKVVQGPWAEPAVPEERDLKDSNLPSAKPRFLAHPNAPDLFPESVEEAGTAVKAERGPEEPAVMGGLLLESPS